ncbi:MAG: DEAD/DEAH box helicase [Candidatus Binatia bacterium]
MTTHASSLPARGFPQFALAPALQRGISALGFTEPTPIQAQTIAAALDHRDILGLAQTGTGKTAAFALPILQRLYANRRPGPRALILAPTRELATQIQTEVRALARFTQLTSLTVFGGIAFGPQVRSLRARPDVIVACPGRLLDLLQQGEAKLGSIEVLVLDEADHMFDMGFLPTVHKILAALPPKRQNLLFSATMPPEVRALTGDLLDRPHVVELAHSRPASTIEHAVYPVRSDRKLDLLRHVLADDGFTSAIVFLRTKHRARRLADDLSGLGYAAVALQGNMSQSQRDRAMNGFRDGTFDVLVATDIAARGIDVANVSHVINFDVPNTADAYTHRIGRTGRAERNGRALTFVCDEDGGAVRDIERRLGTAIPRCVVPGFEHVAQSSERDRPHALSRPAHRGGAPGSSNQWSPRVRRQHGGPSAAGRNRRGRPPIAGRSRPAW